MKPKSNNSAFQLVPFILSLAITLSIGVVAMLYTRPQIKTWYINLIKPDFTPPNWLFPIAWTVLYILIATSAYLVWKLRDNSLIYKCAVAIYFIQLGLNFSWSIIFFGMHQILGGVVIIVALLVAIVLNISWFGRFSKLAAWLLVPYLLWASYAALLNIGISVLNK